ncbi:hypothetical protein [Chryseobacterium polytrichastri]|uniref:Uncharacterized protein n=1 Tax=Chryseobacterium polytrichastri TaxID=1302687 RepID=A0A1M7DNX1_9FLAO|nr:hypothetical protein [Chryseobacterium polytrichastri]SHL81098.1 hypothetical protein SAMN05444267_102554 [Chryseobacterium polytrichastri]
MKALQQMFNVEKGKLLADLLPEELPNITLFIEAEAQRFLNSEEQIKSQWSGTLVTSSLWYGLVRNVEKAVKKYGDKFRRNHRLFSEQLFDGYDALFTIHCLVECSLKEDCNYKLRLAIHLLFGAEKLIVTDFQSSQK